MTYWSFKRWVFGIVPGLLFVLIAIVFLVALLLALRINPAHAYVMGG